MNRKGFTLIELLIVVAIIGIIAAIAVPTLLSTRGAAAKNKAKATLRQISTAENAYYARNNAYAEFADLAAAENGGPYLDARFAAGEFTEDNVTYSDVTIDTDAGTFEATATLADSLGGQVYTIDQSGYITET
jgi:type IV pilus assembly protein PilA